MIPRVSSQLVTMQSPRLDPNIEAMCGAGAAFCNITATFPINKIMFRQQLHNISFVKAVGQLQKEGLTVLYRGLLPPLMQKTTSLAIMFGTYEEYQRMISNYKPTLKPLYNKALAALLSGTSEAMLTPFERIQVLLQNKYFHDQYRNTFHAFRKLGQNFGVREYFRGLTPILLRNGPSNVIFFLLRGEIRQCLPEGTHGEGSNLTLDFISGGVLGAVISTLFFPLNVVKARMQSKVGGDFISIRTAYLILYEERGRKWHKFFTGVHVNYTRSLISWGIINATYELLKRHFFSKIDDE